MKFISAFITLFASVIGYTTRAADDRPPNVVLIISDDHGFPDYGFMQSRIANTPNLDRMASASLLYTRGYVMPVCSPSLASLLTGQLPHVHCIKGNDLSSNDMKPLSANGRKDRAPLSSKLLGNSVILPKLLTDAGYLTFQTGKLWNVTAEEVGFTSGMTKKEGRHGGEGLAIGRESMKPIYEMAGTLSRGVERSSRPTSLEFARQCSSAGREN